MSDLVSYNVDLNMNKVLFWRAVIWLFVCYKFDDGSVGIEWEYIVMSGIKSTTVTWSSESMS